MPTNHCEKCGSEMEPTASKCPACGWSPPEPPPPSAPAAPPSPSTRDKIIVFIIVCLLIALPLIAWLIRRQQPAAVPVPDSSSLSNSGGGNQ